MNHRVEDLHRFVQSPDFICPWGVAAADQGKITYVEDGSFARMLVGLTRWHEQGQGSVLCLVANVDPVRHSVVEEHVWGLFAKLCVAAYYLSDPGPEPQETLRVLRKQVLADVRAMRLPNNPYKFPALRGTGMLIVATSPHYPRSHPRWSPHLALWVTSVHDVVEIEMQGQKVQRVRKAMLRQCGVVYDAIAVFLPLQPKAATR